MTTPNHDHLDPDLRRLAESLDDLGAAERDAAPEDLERVLLATTLPRLRATTDADRPEPRPLVIARISPHRAARSFHLAAAVVLLATAGVASYFLIRSLRPAPTTPPVARSTEQLIEDIDAQLDDWLDDLATLEDRYAESAAPPDAFWNVDDELESLLEESS